MDEIKKRIVALIGQDRVRARGHFWREAAKDGVLLEDALRAVRRGAFLPGQADTDSSFGERFRIRGTDTQDRVLDVIVSIDEQANLLWLHTVFISGRKKGTR